MMILCVDGVTRYWAVTTHHPVRTRVVLMLYLIQVDMWQKRATENIPDITYV